MNEWVSVEDETPEVDEAQGSTSEDVLILDNDDRMYVGHMSFYSATGYRKESAIKWSANETGCGCCSENLDPTHWMPLPKPPGIICDYETGMDSMARLRINLLKSMQIQDDPEIKKQCQDMIDQITSRE